MNPRIYEDVPLIVSALPTLIVGGRGTWADSIRSGVDTRVVYRGLYAYTPDPEEYLVRFHVYSMWDTGVLLTSDVCAVVKKELFGIGDEYTLMTMGYRHNQQRSRLLMDEAVGMEDDAMRAIRMQRLAMQVSAL